MKKKGQQYIVPGTKSEKNLNSFDINKYANKLNKTSFNDTQISDQVQAKTDRFNLLRESHVLAKAYGLGGCKSLSEYVEMINNEDPAIISALMAIITEEMRCEAGFKPREIKYLDERTENNYLNDSGPVEKVDTRHKEYNETVASYLMYTGHTLKELKEKMATIDVDKNYVGDFSDITAEALDDPNFDMEGAFERFREFKKHSVNFDVTPEQFHSYGK